MASTFIRLKRNCPICAGARRDCRKSSRDGSELIHCRSGHEPPQGWRQVGEDAYGFGLYAEGTGDDRTSDEWRQKQQERARRREQERLEALAALPTLQERHDVLSQRPRRLTAAQNADLLRRGLTQDEIDGCLSRGWIWQERGGYGIAAIDHITGLIAGGQLATDNRNPKYLWLLAGQTNLRETGQNPLAVWVSPGFDSAKPYTLNFCEGFLKPLVSALKSWRSNHQQVWVGAAGGIFQDAAVARAIGNLPIPEAHLLWPDGGAVANPHVLRGYQGLHQILHGLGRRLEVQWWEQITKADPDCDELGGGETIDRLAWDEFAAIARRKHKPDRILNQRYLGKIELPAAGLLTLSAPTGSGKTESEEDLLYQFFHHHPNGLADAIGYRNGLLLQTARRINAKGRVQILHKFQMDRDSGGWKDAQCLAYCVNSLDSRIDTLLQAIDEGRKVLVMLDEAGFILRHALEMMKRQSQTGLNFARLLQRIGQGGGYVVAAQADLDDTTIALLRELTGENFPITSIENVWKGSPWQCNFISVLNKQGEATNALGTLGAFERVLWSLDRGEFPLVVSTGQRWLEVLETALQPAKFFRVDAVTVAAARAAGDFGTREQRLILKLFEDPKGAIAQIRKLGFAAVGLSPTAESGLSIEQAGFDRIIGLFQAGDSEQALQLLARDRNPNVPRDIFCADKAPNLGELLTPEQIRENWRLNTRQSFQFAKARDYLSAEELAVYDRERDRLLEILTTYAARYQAERQVDMAALNANLRARLERAGHGLQLETIGLREETRERWQNAKEKIDRQLHQTFAECPVISLTEAQEIQRSGQGTREQNFSARKTLLLESYPGLPLEDAGFVGRVLFERRGKALEQYRQCWLLKNPAVAAAIDRHCWKGQLQSGIIWEPSIKREAYKASTLADSGILEVISLEEYSEHSPEVQRVKGYCVQNKAELRRVLGYASAFREEHSAIEIVGWLLRRLGLSHKRIRREGGRGNQVWFYRVTDKHANDRAIVEAALAVKWQNSEALQGAHSDSGRSNFSAIQDLRKIGSTAAMDPPPIPPIERGIELEGIDPDSGWSWEVTIEGDEAA